MWGPVPPVFVEIKTIKRGPEICYHLEERTADVSREEERWMHQAVLLTNALSRGPKVKKGPGPPGGYSEPLEQK